MRSWIVRTTVLAACLCAPVATGAETSADLERRATATWTRFERVRYVIDVVETSDTSVDLDDARAAREVTGHARFALELCDEITDPCRAGQTWAAPLSSGTTNGLSFTMDPSMSVATLDGWMRDVETDRPCEVRIAWRTADAATPHADVDPAAAVAHVALMRTASATIDTTCFNTGNDPAYASGVGMLGARLDGTF